MFGLRRKLQLKKARQARSEAQQAYRDALRRRDTRDEHTARLKLVEATSRVLKLEGGA